MARKRRRFTPEFKARVALEAPRERDSVQATSQAARALSEPGERVEAAVARCRAGGVPLGRGAGSSPRSTKRRSGTPAREDRRAHRRAGFFSARARALSRSSLYYRPKGEGAENLALMRRMDELHMEYPFYGSRQMMRHLRREGVAVGRHRIRWLIRQPRLRVWRGRRAPVPSAFPSGAGPDGKTEAGLKPGSGGRVRTGRSETVAVLGPGARPGPNRDHRGLWRPQESTLYSPSDCPKK